MQNREEYGAFLKKRMGSEWFLLTFSKYKASEKEL